MISLALPNCPRFQAGQQRHDKTVVVRIARRRTGTQVSTTP